MKRILNYFWFFLCGLPIQAAFPASTQFKVEMQNYTEAELKFYCKSITGAHKWIFPSGSVIVPPRSSVTEAVEITRASPGEREEILCNYTGQGVSSAGPSPAYGSARFRVTEKTTNSIAIDPSFKGIVRLIVNPAIYSKLKAERVLDTHSEFMVSFEDR